MGIIYEKVDTNLYRGPRPTSAQDLQPFSYGVDVNLEVGFFEFLHGKEHEEMIWCTQTRVIYRHNPFSDVFAPTVDQLKRTVNMITDFSSRGVTTVFHCEFGKDRTGMVAAAYRILVQKWPVEKAKQEMMEHGFHKFPYFYWVPVLDKLGGS